METSLDQSVAEEEQGIAFLEDFCPDPFHRRRCVNCFKVKPPSEPGVFKQCTRCECAVYCSRECQKEDLMIHKKNCKNIRNQLKKDNDLRENIQRIGRLADDEGGPLLTPDILLSLVEGSGEINRQLIHLYISETSARQGRTNFVAAEEGLNQTVQGLLPAMGALLNTEFQYRQMTAPLLFLILGRYKECYDLCKVFALMGSTDPERFNHSIDPDEAYVRRRHDAAESTSNLDLNHHCLNESIIMCIYFIKFWLHVNTYNLHMIDKVFVDQDCTAYIGEFLGLEATMLQVDPLHYFYQAKELLSRLNTYAPGKQCMVSHSKEKEESEQLKEHSEQSLAKEVENECGEAFR